MVLQTRFPERQYPGKFDIYGSSHQIFYILVVFAVVTQHAYRALKVMPKRHYLYYLQHTAYCGAFGC